MPPITRAQRLAIFNLFNRPTGRENEIITHRRRSSDEKYIKPGYRAFRRTVQPGPGCLMVAWCGMWLGIEPDGYTHS